MAAVEEGLNGRCGGREGGTGVELGVLPWMLWREKTCRSIVIMAYSIDCAHAKNQDVTRQTSIMCTYVN